MVDRSNGTNGELSIEEVLEKDPLIRKLLDEDETVEYISYKKGKNSKSFIIVIFILVIFMLKIFPWGRTLYGNILFTFAILSILLFSLILSLGVLKGKLVVTNKGIIVRSFINWKIKDSLLITEKFNYSEIEKIESVTLENYPCLRFRIPKRQYLYKSYPIFSDMRLEEVSELKKIIEKKKNEKDGLERKKELVEEITTETLEDEKINLINKILDENEDIKNSKTGTNGNLTIEEVLLKHPKIKMLLDEGEEVRYIAYNKGRTNKILFIFLLIISSCFFFILFLSKQEINSFLLMINLTFFLIGLNLYKENKEILVFTNKSFLSKRKKSTLKIYYEDLKNIILVGIKNDTLITITDERKSIITTSQKKYVQFDICKVFKKIRESIKWGSKKDVKKSGKNIILGLFLGIIIPFFLGLLNFIPLTSGLKFIFIYINTLLFINLFYKY